MKGTGLTPRASWETPLCWLQGRRRGCVRRGEPQHEQGSPYCGLLGSWRGGMVPPYPFLSMLHTHGSKRRGEQGGGWGARTEKFTGQNNARCGGTQHSSRGEDGSGILPSWPLPPICGGTRAGTCSEPAGGCENGESSTAEGAHTVELHVPVKEVRIVLLSSCS